jgi:uncharacterized membrane protein YeaQ/YmgE (transglycosylase-associated protein family)
MNLLGRMASNSWTQSTAWVNQQLTNYNVNRKYLKYGGYVAGGVGGLMAARSMYGSYSQHGTAANIYTGLGTVGGAYMGSVLAKAHGFGGKGRIAGAAIGAFAGDRLTRFEENHPIVSTALLAGAAGAAYAYKTNPAFRTGLRRWGNKAAVAGMRAPGIAKGSFAKAKGLF